MRSTITRIAFIGAYFSSLYEMSFVIYNNANIHHITLYIYINSKKYYRGRIIWRSKSYNEKKNDSELFELKKKDYSPVVNENMFAAEAIKIRFFFT